MNFLRLNRLRWGLLPALLLGLAVAFTAPLHAEPPAALGLLSAAQSAADAGEYRRAEGLMSGISVNTLDQFHLTQFYTLRAQILLSHGQNEEALKWLPVSGVQGTQAAQVRWLRGQALFRLGNGPGATYELVQREKFLSPNQLQENRDAIWSGLFEIPMDMDVLQTLKNLDPMTRGWVELAVLVRERGSVEQWRANYPGHPAAERIASVRPSPVQPVAAAPAVQMQPAQPVSQSLPERVIGFFTGASAPDSNNIALLLPLTGTFSGTAEAVRDGFMSAYFKKAAATKPSVRIYDAGATPGTTIAAYQQALHDGAGFIVGPLRKEAVAAVVGQGQPPVPLLALNYLDGNAQVFNLFQFGLAPEDEARAAAERAVAEGGRRAIVLTPVSDWGERALAAFTQRLRELGGSIVDSSRYELATRDFATQIKQLMGLADSEARHKALSGIIGHNSEFEQRRRDDADFIFLAARPAEGRLIWPQFRYYRSSSLPIYATSLIYGGAADPELNGVRFCDMPFMLGGKPAVDAVRNDAAGMSALKSQPRLFALGYDAYTLVSLIQKGDLQSGAPYAAATGTLKLNAGGDISRSLDCAQVDNGLPRLLGAAAPAP